MKKPETHDLFVAMGTATIVILISILVGKVLDRLDLRTEILGIFLFIVIILGIVGVVHAIGHNDHKEEIDIIIKKLERITLPTGFNWLYNDIGLIEIECKIKCRNIWIISPNLSRDTVRADIQKAVKKNIKRGIAYTFILPETETINALLPALRNLFASNSHLLRVVRIPEDTFRYLTVRHIAVYNPDMLGDEAPRVLLELPTPRGGYWVEAAQDAAISLTGRFRRFAEEETSPQVSHRNV